MKSVLRIVLGVTLATALPVSTLFAEEEAKALPTLLIKGEVVSLDANDPSAVLLKVKDKYGFETPIFLSQQTKITQGDATVTPTNLATGTAVEVEYNFDINTAKRHAVSVKVSTPTASAAAATPPSAAPMATPMVQPPVQPAAVQPTAAAPAAPTQQQAAPATQ